MLRFQCESVLKPDDKRMSEAILPGVHRFLTTHLIVMKQACVKEPLGPLALTEKGTSLVLITAVKDDYSSNFRESFNAFLFYI